MNKKKFLTLTTTGFALFAMFFGAGNLVIPPYIGLKMGAASGAAFVGFFPFRDSYSLFSGTNG